MDNLNSLRFDGMGSCVGGEFDRVDISGMGKVNGNIKCNAMDVSGMAKIFGKIYCDKLSVSGTIKIEDEVIVKELEVSGTFKGLKDAQVNKFEISGIAKVEGSLKSEEIYCEGILKVKENIEAEKVDIRGNINSGGFLNCEILEMSLAGTSEIKEIGATNINVKNGKITSSAVLNVILPSKFKNNKLIAEVIEGDDIYLENCEVKIVRGKNVKIGPKCNIQTVEYTNSIEIDDTVKIKNVEKI